MYSTKGYPSAPAQRLPFGVHFFGSFKLYIFLVDAFVVVGASVYPYILSDGAEEAATARTAKAVTVAARNETILS